jgi:hypothetical protein
MSTLLPAADPTSAQKLRAGDRAALTAFYACYQGLVLRGSLP